VRTVLSRNSEAGTTHATLRIKRVQEALGGIRDILIDRSQPVFERQFERSAAIFRRASTVNAFIGQSPRIVIEMIGVAMLALYAGHLANSAGGLVSAIPMLGAFVLGAQRLLPLLQQSYTGWASFISNRYNVVDVVKLISLPAFDLPASVPSQSKFRELIVFDKVSFSYKTGSQVLSDISLIIAKGERLGIAGTTGSGKSTLMDLLLGLLDPTDGAIRIDGLLLDDATRAMWQSEIAHVPQAIYLIDDTVAANIAFGIPSPDIDMPRVKAAARAAGLDEFISNLPGGYQTATGERGVRLSGGQRQRIGIARALYKQASVLVFDEATSALDTRTEEEVMTSIAGLGKDITIIMIAHRLSTLKDCDRIIYLENGRIDRVIEMRKAAGQ
jgi:ABC-type multidrug transport system fused ATPase/permease subunit